MTEPATHEFVSAERYGDPEGCAAKVGASHCYLPASDPVHATPDAPAAACGYPGCIDPHMIGKPVLIQDCYFDTTPDDNSEHPLIRESTVTGVVHMHGMHIRRRQPTPDAGSPVLDTAAIRDQVAYMGLGPNAMTVKIRALCDEIDSLRSRLAGEIELRVTFQAESERGEEMVAAVQAQLVAVTQERDAAVAEFDQKNGVLMMMMMNATHGEVKAERDALRAQVRALATELDKHRHEYHRDPYAYGENTCRCGVHAENDAAHLTGRRVILATLAADGEAATDEP